MGLVLVLVLSTRRDADGGDGCCSKAYCSARHTLHVRRRDPPGGAGPARHTARSRQRHPPKAPWVGGSHRLSRAGGSCWAAGQPLGAVPGAGECSHTPSEPLGSHVVDVSWCRCMLKWSGLSTPKSTVRKPQSTQCTSAWDVMTHEWSWACASSSRHAQPCCHPSPIAY